MPDLTQVLGAVEAGAPRAGAARVLGIKLSAAVNRYVRALSRLRDAFQGVPGGIEGVWG
jgi:hypothetical protein